VNAAREIKSITDDSAENGKFSKIGKDFEPLYIFEDIAEPLSQSIASRRHRTFL